MKAIKFTTLAAACLILSACAQTALEQNFGDSVRGMISAQTLNPDAQPAAAQNGDGQRLEGVLGDYRDTATTRTSVSSDTRLGVQ